METLEVGKRLVALCREGKNRQCMQELYDKDIVSVEAQPMQNLPQEVRGIEAIYGKDDWFNANHTIHSAKVEGPWPHGDRFAVKFNFDITNKPSGQRYQMEEIALYTVKNGKIVKEEYFYGA
jgi:hypothetical protein